MEKELLKEQYIKVWFQKLNDKFLIVQISSDFHRILRKHDRFFSHIEGEIQQLKRFHGSTIYLHN